MSGVFSNDRIALGGNTRRGDLVHTTETWSLDRSEINDLIGIQILASKESLAEEQQKGNLLEHNRFVDNSQYKALEEVKFGGKVEYNHISGLANVMLYIDRQLRILTAKLTKRRTGRLLNSASWRRNGQAVDGYGVPILDQGDQLVVYSNVPYAKYIEFGFRAKFKADYKGRYIYRKVAAKARARFGRAYLIEHKLLQTSHIPPDRIVKFRTRNGRTFAYNAFSQKYYKKRWDASYPAIKITQKTGVRFHV